MKVKILLFAEARDIIEADSIEIEVNEQTSKTEIFKQIEAKFESLAPILEVCNLAHNHSYVSEEAIVVSNRDELALIPPIGGG